MSAADCSRFNFEGKLLLVYLINAPEAFAGGIAINKPQVVDFCGRTFLIGEVPTNSQDWAYGLKTAIAFDQICHFLEFTDEDEYKKRMANTALFEKGGSC